MKTFTLRLTDLEAAALDRLAYINGRSKNKMIAAMIAEKYSDADSLALVVENEVIGIPEEDIFCYGVMDAVLEKYEGGTEDIPAEDDTKILRAIDYSIETTEDPEKLKKLEAMKSDFFADCGLY